MTLKVGGWTRIWLVLSGVFFLFGFWVGDAEKASAEVDAWQRSLITGGLPSLNLGTVFLSLGWIRRGFRRAA